MHYSIREIDGKFFVQDHDGNVVSQHASRSDAEAAVRAETAGSKGSGQMNDGGLYGPIKRREWN